MTKKKTWLFVILAVIVTMIAAFCALFAGTKEYSTGCFTFQVPRTYKLNAEEDDMDFYFGWLNKDLPIRVIAVEQTAYYYYMSAAAWGANLADHYLEEGEYTEISRGDYSGLSMDAYSFVNMQTTDMGNEVYYYHYVLQAGECNLYFMASSEKNGCRQVEKTMKKLLQSVTYTEHEGHRIPDQKFESEYVSFFVDDDKWMLNQYGCENRETDCNVNYALADDYVAAMGTSLTIRTYLDGEYENAQAMADDHYESRKNNQSDATTLFEPVQTELRGVPAIKWIRETSIPDDGWRVISYYMDVKDVILQISIRTPLTDDGTVLAELEALLENLVIKTE